MRTRRTAGGLLGALLLALWVMTAAAEELHGENSEFVGRGLSMAWAILKAPVEAESQVVVRIARPGPGPAAISVDGVDPFTGERRELLRRGPLPEQLEFRSPRGSFAELTRREFHFYAAAEAAGRPGLTIYFMGVPDTAPEFLEEAALGRYLDQTMARLAGSRRGP
jgi:hypothetical protein